MDRFVTHVRWLGVALLLFVAQPGWAETTTYMVTDAQGTVVAQVDRAGHVTYEAAYRPYGRQDVGIPQAGPGYTGHVNDPDTGLVYMQQRYYDPDIGRFLSMDPVGPSVGNVFNFNRYAYANNSPVVLVDPTGMHTASESDMELCGGPVPCDWSSGSSNGGGISASSPFSKINNKNVINQQVAVAATADANKALKNALQTTYPSTDAAEAIFRSLVQPVASYWDTEIGAKMFEVNGGRIKLGAPISDGVICSLSAICSVNVRLAPDVAGIFAGYTHTHTNNIGLSASDLYILFDLHQESGAMRDAAVYANGPDGRSNKWSTRTLRENPQSSWRDYLLKTTTWVP